MSIPLLIHMDPIITDDAVSLETKAELEAFLLSQDERLKLHDFRRVQHADRVTLLFDVMIPPEMKDISPLKHKIEDFAKGLDGQNECVIDFDPDYYQ